MITIEGLSPSLREALTPKAREVFVGAYNSAYDMSKDSGIALQAGFSALRDQFKQVGGRWVHKALWSATVPITKTEPKRMMAFGWLYVSETAEGEQVIDHSGEFVTIEDLELAAYDWMLESQEGGDNHTRTGVARVVECFVCTPEKLVAMGIEVSKAPAGWWVGFKIDDPEVWAKVESGEYAMMSIGGTAIQEEVEEPAAA
jgi:hypothetical protein